MDLFADYGALPEEYGQATYSGGQGPGGFRELPENFNEWTNAEWGTYQPFSSSLILASSPI